MEKQKLQKYGIKLFLLGRSTGLDACQLVMISVGLIPN